MTRVTGLPVAWFSRAAALLIVGVADIPAAVAATRNAGSTINYAFATDLGSGVYDLSGRSLQVYRFTPTWTLREAHDGEPALRFVLPLTAGFFDFSPGDALHGSLPSGIDSFSVMPGLQWDWRLKDDWHLLPYVRVGASFVHGGRDGALFGAGVQLQRDWQQGETEFSRLHELTLASVSYHNQADDRFMRLRQAFEVRRPFGAPDSALRVMAGFYAILDVVPDPPALPNGARYDVMQLETGVTFGTKPRLQVWRIRLPRIGVGYRFAGALSGWRLALGAPF